MHWPEGAQRESEIADYDAYYGRLGSAGDLPTTSQPSIGDFLAVYEPLLDAGRGDRLHPSGRRHVRHRARRPSRPASSSATRAERVHVIDSATACGGEGLVAWPPPRRPAPAPTAPPSPSTPARPAPS